MGKVIWWNMVTVDGFFEGPGNDIGWFVFDEELEKYIRETQEDAKALLFGRKTYQLMAGYWPSAEGWIADFMNGAEKHVFSTTLESADWNNTRLVREKAPEEVSKLKAGKDGDIFLFGSADFAATLVEHDLIDEYRIGLNPLILGKGTPMFKGSGGKLGLTLLEARPLKSGLIVLHYGREQRRI
ncbi:Dihydrofolate reductase [Mesorhizobium albiziae]|uniref:Dihydrofolate reductase n=1 Tax=Neomesorhizobium albiziae TaxID=335020 RepID=A0A1I4BFV2_9HYPH|nr:dihydrofolate reductase family protein [Mesorhizobium albiziae]GLS29812.1 riboflavin biosynthesis protein RibD [Mesorhizobium albiziae]SFK66891.1 Dihydrofolate reductase [Mesorhizobium albiziae]